MTLTPGARLGSYEILAPLGAGGMGEVYRAKDTKLNRDVAIKVLPESFALDADRVARFTREAQVLASLNHPNIAQIYGVETNSLVMELVEGDDLSAIIARGPIALSEALPIAKQIADALEAAHEQGIVHRDLKPQNIKVRADGTVKVLDFGLAKAMDPAGSASGEAMNSPTMTARATQMGMIIGTAAYMSPEQAKGRVVDKRTDIWAFGVVLYEMLTGTRAFQGDEITETLAAVLKDSVTFDALPATTPPRLRALIERCVERDVKLRLRDIGEARIELAKIADGRGEPAISGREAAPGSSRLPWTVATVSSLVAVAALGAVIVMWRSAGGAPSSTASSSITMTALTSSGSAELATLSPDAKYVAYVETDASGQSVWMRQLASGSTVRIVAAEAGVAIRGLTIAPDASFVDVVRGDALWRVPFLGGAARMIIDKVSSAPGWSPDGKQMAYLLNGDAEADRRLIVADADGANPRQVAKRLLPKRYFTLSLSSRPDLRPVWLPDGRTIAVMGSEDNDANQIVGIDVATGAETQLRSFPRTMTDAGSFSGFRSGLALARGGDSFVLNLADGGSPTQIVTINRATGVVTPLTSDLSLYAGASVAGDALVSTRYQFRSSLWITDAAGRNARQVGRDMPSDLSGPAWVDGSHVVVGATLAGGDGLWAIDVNDGGSSLIVPKATMPSTSLDGSALVFMKGNTIWRADGSGNHAVPIGGSKGGVRPRISPDGSKVVYLSTQSGPQIVWVADLSGGTARAFSQERAAGTPSVSPDGQLVAFRQANGAPAIVVLRSDGSGAVQRLKVDAAGASLGWTPDSRSLAFVDATGTNVWTQSLDGGAPKQLTSFPDRTIRSFAWSPDGKQLAVTRTVTTSDIVLLKGVR